MNEHHSQDVR